MVTKLDYIPFKFAQKLIINLNLFIMKNIAIENKIQELRDKVKKQEDRLESQRHYLVSNVTFYKNIKTFRSFNNFGYNTLIINYSIKHNFYLYSVILSFRKFRFKLIFVLYF